MFAKFRPEQSVGGKLYDKEKRKARPYVRADAIFPRVPKTNMKTIKLETRPSRPVWKERTMCAAAAVFDFKHQTHV